MKKLTILALMGLFCTPVQAQVKTQTVEMGFYDCKNRIIFMKAKFGIAPEIIADTSDVKMVRFPTSDGSVIVTCSRPDEKMAVTQSPYR